MGVAGGLLGQKAEEILENIVLLAELFDNEALEQLADVQFMELTKAVSINSVRPSPPREVGICETRKNEESE